MQPLNFIQIWENYLDEQEALKERQPDTGTNPSSISGPYTSGKVKPGQSAPESVAALVKLVEIGTGLAQGTGGDLDEIMTVFDDMFEIVQKLKQQIGSAQ